MTGRVALVTGAAGHIGRAVVQAFVDDRWIVAGSDSRDPADGPWTTFVTADLAEPTSAQRLAQHVLDEHGRIDAVVNNAAVQLDRSLAETTDEDWSSVMAVNLDAAFRLVRELSGALAAHRGAIVNISSVHAIATSASVAAYAVSKAALAGLTRTAAVELGPSGVRVNAVLPGAVMTPMLLAGLERREHAGGPEGNLAALVARTPLGFVAAPEQIAPTVVFLADGERSPYTTGQTLVIDGGATARLATE